MAIPTRLWLVPGRRARLPDLEAVISWIREMEARAGMKPDILCFFFPGNFGCDQVA